MIVSLGFINLLQSCSTSTAIVNQNLSYLYDKDQTFLHPEYVLYNLNDSLTRVYVRINPAELLFAKQPDKPYASANYSVSMKLQASFENQTIIDSATISVEILDTSKQNYNYAYGELKSRKGNAYLITSKFTDINRNQFISYNMVLDRSKTFNPNDMLLTAAGEDLPIFSNAPSGNQALSIHSAYKPAGGYQVDVFKKDFPLPAPPFAMVEPAAFDLKPDSTFYIDADLAKNFKLKDKGIYWIRRKADDNGGFTICRFYDGYPKIANPEMMVPPLRYLTSKQEFKEITESPTKRAGMEKFWTDCAGSQDRARELIKVYYNRVKDANVYFGSYLEGWKTDRGLVYTIFGPPNIIYRNSSNEQWIYGAENNLMSLSFTFLKMENPFTDNDYSLSRNGTYKNGWYQAVDSWRQGRVYLDN